MPRESVYIKSEGYEDSTIDVRWNKVGDSGWGYVQVAIPDLTTPETPAGNRDLRYSQPMNRDQINDLIRMLRKARNGAFGRDE